MCEVAGLYFWRHGKSDDKRRDSDTGSEMHQVDIHEFSSKVER